MHKTLTITLIGAESTGKTTLTKSLAEHFKGDYILEFARFYVENLRRPYTYEDVILIAQRQVWQWQEKKFSSQTKMLFLDTDLIITKIWLEVVFNKVPYWIDEHIVKMKPDLYLFCETDIPWQPDKVRENPGQMRQWLSERYLEEIHKIKAKYAIVTGMGQTRLQNAIEIVNLALHNELKIIEI